MCFTCRLNACVQAIFEYCGFKDRPGDPLLPTWPAMQQIIKKQLFKQGEGQHIHESKGKVYPYGCCFTDLGSYISERYAGEHGDEYAKVSLLHEKTLEQRIALLEKRLPGLQSSDIKKPFSVLDPLLLVLCLMVM